MWQKQLNNNPFGQRKLVFIEEIHALLIYYHMEIVYVELNILVNRSNQYLHFVCCMSKLINAIMALEPGNSITQRMEKD